MKMIRRHEDDLANLNLLYIYSIDDDKYIYYESVFIIGIYKKIKYKNKI